MSTSTPFLAAALGDVQRTGLFISHEGVARTRQAYETFRDSPDWNWLNAAPFVNGGLAESALFDDWYLCIYLMRLTGYKDVPVHASADAGDLKKLLSLKTLHRIDLKPVDEKASFEDTLIDEHLVADVLLFIQSMKRLVPYETHISSVGTGCLWFQFNVFGDSGGKPVKDLPFLRKAMVEAVADKTDHLAWAALKRRFHIEAIELSGAPAP